MGGWSEVLAMRSRKEKNAFDSRVLGDSDFVQELKFNLDDLYSATYINAQSFLKVSFPEAHLSNVDSIASAMFFKEGKYLL